MSNLFAVILGPAEELADSMNHRASCAARRTNLDDPREVCGEYGAVFGDFLQLSTGTPSNAEARAATIGLRRQTRWLPAHRRVVSLLPAECTRRDRGTFDGDPRPFVNTVRTVRGIRDVRYRLAELAASDTTGQGGTP
jgi:hypothetical protein